MFKRTPHPAGPHPIGADLLPFLPSTDRSNFLVSPQPVFLHTTIDFRASKAPKLSPDGVESAHEAFFAPAAKRWCSQPT